MALRAPSSAATRERILAAAGPLFALRGLEGLGIRQLAATAKVNLAAVNYHFGTKHALFREVCLRHLRVINTRRAEGFVRLEAARGRPRVEDILRAYLAPLVGFARSGDPSNLLFMRVVMAQVARRDPALQSSLAAESAPTLARALDLFARALPGVGRDDLALGLSQVIGSTTHLLMNEAAARRPLGAAALLERIVEHGAAGLRALRRS